MYDCLLHAIDEDTKPFNVELVQNSAHSLFSIY